MAGINFEQNIQKEVKITLINIITETNITILLKKNNNNNFRMLC